MSRYFRSAKPETVGIYIKLYAESLTRSLFRRFHISMAYIDFSIIEVMTAIDLIVEEERLSEPIRRCEEDPVNDGKEDARDDDFCRDYGLLTGKAPGPAAIASAVCEVIRREFVARDFLEAVGEFGDLAEIDMLDSPENGASGNEYN